MTTRTIPTKPSPGPAVPDTLIDLGHGRALYRVCPSCGSADLSVTHASRSPHGYEWRQKCCAGCGDLGWAPVIYTTVMGKVAA